MKRQGTLTWKEVAVSLITLHYGLGFLIGSGEAIYLSGVTGILYAFSTVIGLFSLLFIAKFYWKKRAPIWTLMGARYGAAVKETIAFLSCIWMIGVVASQVQGGASILQTLGLSQMISVPVMATVITLLSLISLSRMVRLFSFMLVISSLSLISILIMFGIDWIPKTMILLFKAQREFTLSDFLGILTPTVLVTFIGMDFHQFIVKARTSADAVKGIIAAGVGLVIISLILLSVVVASIQNNLLYDLQNPKQTIPLILHNFGNGFSPFVSLMLSLPIIFVAIGSGSGVNRIINRSITDSRVMPDLLRKKPNVFFLVFFFVLMISYSGDSIVGLIVAFYAIYVGSVFIPFLASLLDARLHLKIKRKSILAAIYASVIGTLSIYLYSYVPKSFVSDDKATYMVIVGFVISLLILIFYNSQQLFKYLIRSFKYQPYIIIRAGFRTKTH